MCPQMKCMVLLPMKECLLKKHPTIHVVLILPLKLHRTTLCGHGITHMIFLLSYPIVHTTTALINYLKNQSPSSFTTSSIINHYPYTVPETMYATGYMSKITLKPLKLYFVKDSPVKPITSEDTMNGPIWI